MDDIPFDTLAATVVDIAGQPIAKRMRAMFYLRTIGTPEAVRVLCQALEDKAGSCLYRHELAYVLGQMRDATAVPALTAVLEDVADDVIVRHECAEALGAIAHEDSFPVLEKFAADPAPEVSETCAIADDDAEDKAEATHNPYESVDPAPAASAAKSPAELGDDLMNTGLPLYERYRAMFALRNIGDDACVAQLVRGLKDGSALFRHEIAYVLGQMMHPGATDALAESLLTAGEHPMVRHEAAEALGAIGTTKAVELLQAHMDDSEQVVRESCEVALDVVDYWGQDKPGTSTAE